MKVLDTNQRLLQSLSLLCLISSANAIAAVVATINKIDITSKGNTQEVNRAEASIAGVPSSEISDCGNNSRQNTSWFPSDMHDQHTRNL